MKLRSLILVFLLFFGLTPLVSSVVLNLPLVLDRIELFYQKAYLQNLRADFRDLDQHLASRHEMIRLLAKLPEPGLILGEDGETEQIDLARARYTAWINQILHEQGDITQILFLDSDGQDRFWLERDPKSLNWRPTTTLPDRPADDFIEAGQRMNPGGVLVSPIRIDRGAGEADAGRFMNLYLISAIGGTDSPGNRRGAVVMNVNLAGMAQFYRNTLWVNQDGSFLRPGETDRRQGEAFRDFPGLKTIFEERKLSIWKGPRGEQFFWVPMFLTEDAEPLWVGRPVDPSPITAFRNALIVRVLSIVFVVIVVLLLVARWVAVRLERFGQRLTDEVGRVLREDAPIRFAWGGPRELRALGDQLTALAKTHADHVRALRTHAEELERSYRYKSEFLANISHELRTPLNSILLLSKLLADSSSSLSSEQKQQARVIHEAGADLKNMIDNILDISRIEAGRVEVNLEWRDIRSVLPEVVELMRPLFAEKGLYLETRVEPDAPERVHTDWSMVNQILKNFLSNAVKFTVEGGVVVEAARFDETAPGLRISVRDTGIGIPADKQQLIFEAFRQADGSTRRRFGGTGLGLTISRGLANLLGGRITLESAEGRGSCFSLLLPIDRPAHLSSEEAVSEPIAASSDSGGTGVPDPLPVFLDIPAVFAGRSVLIVEQSARNLMEMASRLGALGLRVLAAANAEEALETLGEEAGCALVLVDARMPEDDTYDTITAIRRERTSGDLPVLVAAAPEDQTQREKLYGAGANGLLPVPCDEEQLRATLAQFLSDTAPTASTQR